MIESITNESNSAKHRWRDGISFAFAWGSATVVVIMVVWILWTTLVEGLPELSWAFLTETPRDAGRGGGIRPMIVSTIWIVGVCMAVSFPIGLATATLLSEFVTEASRGGRSIRLILNVLAGVPSIVFGLFGNAFFSQTLGLGYSILSGGLTLACMVLPIFVRLAEAALRSVPREYRDAAEALGISRWTTIRRVLAPVAAPAIAAGFVLACGRAFAETAALIFTSGYVTRMPESVWDSGRSLSVHVYDMAMNVPGGDGRAFATALVLVALILLINIAATLLTQQACQRSLAERE